jgi:hypothetical protein
MMWGERPIPLEKDALTRRIYAPLAYPLVRNSAIVPVVHSEAFHLASWFPLVWQRRDGAVEFVAVRSLLNDQRAQPPAARTLLPLILHAYPFVFDPSKRPERDNARMLDDVFADAPTDIGASITTVDRKLSRATTMRFRTLDAFARDFALTHDLGQTLAALKLFDPWELKFNIDGRQLEIPNLVIVRQAAFDTGAFSPILEKFGVPAATLLALHRISIYRAGILLAAARAFLKAEAAAQAKAAASPFTDIIG